MFFYKYFVSTQDITRSFNIDNVQYKNTISSCEFSIQNYYKKIIWKRNMAKRLHYFDFNGLAESIRYILHYGNHKFEDVRYGNNEWPNEKVKEFLPFGQMPLYQEGDRNLNQSVAIARYVGTLSNLVPSDPWEQAVLDAVVLNIYDLWFKACDFFREADPARKEEKKKTFLTESIDYFFTRFEDQLAKNNGFFGGKLSWADFVFVGIVESINVIFGAQVESNYPNSSALIQKIRNLPGVKEYIATRKPLFNIE